MSMLFGLIGLILLIALIGAVVLLSSLAVLFVLVLGVLWLGTLLYYVFVHRDKKTSSTDYSIGQGKTIE